MPNNKIKINNTPVLFQGQRKDTKEWIVGYLVKFNNSCYIYYEEVDEFCQTGSWLTYKEVFPESVGQFTGYRTKKEPIYVGDVLELTRRCGKKTRVLVQFGGDFAKGACILYYGGKSWDYMNVLEDPFGEVKSYKKLGNYFDNPELFEKEQ